MDLQGLSQEELINRILRQQQEIQSLEQRRMTNQDVASLSLSTTDNNNQLEVGNTTNANVSVVSVVPSPRLNNLQKTSLIVPSITTRTSNEDDLPSLPSRQPSQASNLSINTTTDNINKVAVSSSTTTYNVEEDLPQFEGVHPDLVIDELKKCTSYEQDQK